MLAAASSGTPFHLTAYNIHHTLDIDRPQSALALETAVAQDFHIVDTQTHLDEAVAPTTSHMLFHPVAHLLQNLS